MSDYGHFLRDLGLRSELAEGTVRTTMPMSREVANPRGGMQGGMLATLIDVAGGTLATIGMPPDQTVATADLNIHYLRPVAVGPAVAEATVLRRGRSTVVVGVDVHDAGREVLAAVATITFTVVGFRPGQADPGRPRTSVT